MKNRHNNLLKFNFAMFLLVFLLIFFEVSTFAEINDAPVGSSAQSNQAPSTSSVINSGTTNSLPIPSSSTSPETSSANSSSFGSTSKVITPPQSSTQPRAAVSSPATSTNAPAASTTTEGSTNVIRSKKVISSSPTPSASTSENNTNNAFPHPNAATKNKSTPVKPETSANSEQANNEQAKESQNVASSKPTEETKKEEKIPEDETKKQTPEDLPAVESEEIAFPEVVASANAEDSNSPNYFAGIIAWVCILIGIAIVIFVMLKGRSAADVPIQNLSSGKKRRRKGKHLLPNDYYRDRF